MLKTMAMAALAALFSGSVTFAQEGPSRTPIPGDASIRAVVERAVDDFIRPGYRDFQIATGRLTASMEHLCSKPSPDALASARETFSNTASRWARIEIVRTGPALLQNRFERVLFYPDRKSTGLKQVQRLLAKPDEAATDHRNLPEKSVAVQGLGALEFILFGTGNEALTTEVESFRCRYGQAVARNIEQIARELTDLWDEPDGIQRSWKEPGTDNPLFRNEREVMTALLGILVHGAEMVRDQRIETFYRGGDKTTFAKQAILWRSGNTWTMIEGNIKALQELIDVSDMEDLLADDLRSIIGSVEFVLKSLLRVTSEMNPDIEVAVSDRAQREKLDFLLINGRDLITRLNDQYGGAIGLTSGFSFSDGD